MKRIEFLLNWELKDRLMRLGYPVKDGRFAFDVTVGLPLEKRIEVDKKVAEQVDVPESYWYDTYGIPMPTAAERIKLDKAKEDAPKADPATPKKEEEGEADDEVDRADTASMQKAIDRLYRAHGHTHGFTAAGGPDEDSDGIMDELARAFHDGRITGDHVDPKLMQWTADQLFKGVMGGMDLDDGAGPQSEQLQAFMRDNVFTFSGFKSYQVAKAVSAELMDEDGQFRSFVDFKKRVLAIDETYNKNYLRSEYEHAVASGQMAQRWTDLQADRDLFPFLRYSTVGDDRVRDEHEGYDGITEHIDHPFWDTNYPPNGWRCRCDVEQVARLGGGRSLPANWEPVRKGMFASNVGKDGVVFPKDHPYSSKAPKAVKAKVEKLVQDVLGDEGAAITNRAQGTPVSGSLTTDNKALSTVLTRTMKAIDSVHGDGVLSAIPLKPTRAKAFGFYRSTFYNAVDIGVRLTGDHQHLTLAHEVGHWLDHIGLGQGVSWGTSSIASAEMKAVQAAMAQSKVIKGINEVLNTGIVKDTAGNDVRLPLRLRKYYTYLANPKEQWARAYSQYVAVRSGDEALLKDLKTVRSSGIPTQWTAKDFAPIAKAIDLLFIAKGWRTK
jgi:SPP1 gp7 family putative phage head morphogenesis protein